MYSTEIQDNQEIKIFTLSLEMFVSFVLNCNCLLYV